VGPLDYIGQQAMARRLGQFGMLLQLPRCHPVTYRRVISIFFFKDATFYVLYSIIPIVAGIAVAAPLAHVTYGGVALLGLTLFLAFMTGMSLSFLASSIASQSRVAGGGVAVAVLILLASIWPLRVLPPGYLLPSLGFWDARQPLFLLVATIVVILLSTAAVLSAHERFETRERKHKSVLLPTEKSFAFTGKWKTLLAKEWIEARRSGAFGAAVTGFIGPLLGLYVLVWIFQRGLGVPINFNIVFYGSLVGFLGVHTYSMLTNFEPNEFLNAQPTTVDRVIHAKLMLFFLLNMSSSISFLAVVGVLTGEATLVPISLLVATAMTVYVAAVTTRLTGLWMNTMLFDAKVLAKFAGSIIPPLVFATILSLTLKGEALLSILLLAGESVVLLVLSFYLFRAASKRWRGEHFSFATIGTPTQDSS